MNARRTATSIALLFAILSGAADVSGAQERAPRPIAGEIAGYENIPVAEWAAMASGKTLTYRINGEIWAREYYHPGTDRVSLQRPNGECMHGHWDYSDPLYCFHWDVEGTACFRHVRDGDRILVIQTEQGVDTPKTQDMTGIDDRPVICTTPGTS